MEDHFALVKKLRTWPERETWPRCIDNFDILEHVISDIDSSDVPARLGLKATALAWLSAASAFKIFRPSMTAQIWLGLA